MVSLINKQLLLTAYAYLFITEQQKAQQGSQALQLRAMVPVTSYQPPAADNQAPVTMMNQQLQQPEGARQTVTLAQGSQQVKTYEIVQQLPDGGQGYVYRLVNGEDVVILKLADSKHGPNFGTEVQNHKMAFQKVPENVVPIIASDESTMINGKVVRDRRHLATQWMNQGDMHQWSKQWLKTTSSAEERLRVATDFRQQMGGTLEKLKRDLRLVHRDVKPGNIFVHEEEGNLKFVLGDFGASVAGSIAEEQKFAGRAATTMYTPQVLLKGSGELDEHYKGDQKIVNALAVSLAKGFPLTTILTEGAVLMVVSMFLETKTTQEELVKSLKQTTEFFRKNQWKLTWLEASLETVTKGRDHHVVAKDLQATLKNLLLRGAQKELAMKQTKELYAGGRCKFNMGAALHEKIKKLDQRRASDLQHHGLSKNRKQHESSRPKVAPGSGKTPRAPGEKKEAVNSH